MNVSFVVPAYNQALYLEDCIESIYGQSFAPYEIIIVNDGSTDNTLEIAGRYCFREFPGIESPVKVITQVNKGLASARNTGIMAATGDYIWPLDADDMLKPNALEKVMTEMQRFNADIYAPSFEEFGLRNNKVVLQAFTLEDLKVANRLGYFSVIRRQALIEAGGYNPKMKWGYEDYALWFDLFSRGKTIAIIQEPLVMYRVKEQSMIHDAQAHHQELMAQIKTDYPHIFQ